MIGIQITKDQVNAVAGQLALDIADTGQRVQMFKAWLDTKSTQDLVDMGFAEGEVDVIKSAFADAAQYVALFTGDGTLAQAKDFRTFLRRLWGFGRK